MKGNGFSILIQVGIEAKPEGGNRLHLKLEAPDCDSTDVAVVLRMLLTQLESES